MNRTGFALALVVGLCVVVAALTTSTVAGLAAMVGLLGMMLYVLSRRDLSPLYAVAPLAIMFYARLFDLHGLAYTALDGTVTMVACASLIFWLWQRQTPDKTVQKLVGLAALLVLVSLVPNLYFAHSLTGIVGVLLFLKKWCLYSVLLLGANQLRGQVASPLVRWGLVSALLFFVVSYGYMATFEDRNVGLMFNPNVFGLFCVLVFNLAVALWQRGVKGWLSYAALAAAAMAVDGVVSSASRTSALALVAVLIFWLLVSRLERKFLLLACTAVIFVAARIVVTDVLLSASNNQATLLSASNHQATLLRWKQVGQQGMQTPGVSFRIDAVKIGLRMLAHSPVIGYGDANYQRLSVPYVERYATLVKDSLATTDNQVVDTALGTGLLGLALAGLMVLWMWQATPAHLRERSHANMLGLASRANLLALVVAGVGMPSFYAPFNSAFVWLIFALAYAARKEEELAARPSV